MIKWQSDKGKKDPTGEQKKEQQGKMKGKNTALNGITS